MFRDRGREEFWYVFNIVAGRRELLSFKLEQELSEQRKSFTSYVILSIGAVVFLLVAAGCQNAGNEKLPDGAKRYLDGEIGTGQYRIVRAERASNPTVYRDNVQEAWCVVLSGPHRFNGFGHPSLDYGDIIEGNYSEVLYRRGNLWSSSGLAGLGVAGGDYATKDFWLAIGCSENTFSNPY